MQFLAVSMKLKDQIWNLALTILFGVFGLVLIFSGPRQYREDGVYKIEHQANRRTYKTEYKTGEQLQSDEVGRFSGQVIFGIIALGLSALFGSELAGANKKKDQPSRTLYDDFSDISMPLIVNGYRRIAAQRGCALGPEVSDAKIIEIYQRVLEAFQTAARARGERIPATILNYIVLYFLQNYQTFGDARFESHLQYEIVKYSQEGLRDDYKQHLSLF